MLRLLRFQHSPGESYSYLHRRWKPETRKIASVRIHVERVIGLVRRKYQILQSRAMPTEHMAVKPGETMPLIDKIR
jgi:hypothetical protein